MAVAWKIYECFFERQLLKTLPCECWDENGMRESLPSCLCVAVFFSLECFLFSLSVFLSLGVCVSPCLSTSLSVCLLPNLDPEHKSLLPAYPDQRNQPKPLVHQCGPRRSSELATSGQSLTLQGGIWSKGQKRWRGRGVGLEGAALPPSSSRASTLITGLPPSLSLLLHVIPNVLGDF